MCKQKILSHTENGYVAVCRQCAYIQVYYISTMMTISQEQYAALVSQVNDLKKEGRKNIRKNKKVFCVHTFSYNIQMVLSYDELIIFDQILNEANMMLELNSYISCSPDFESRGNHKYIKSQILNQYNQINLN